MCFCFFFKQKTAYEMRISDWSSDVCSSDLATWVLTSYLVANAVVIPISGWLSDAIGRKRYFMISIALFTISSLLCGLAPNLTTLVLARVFEGIGGGGLAPVEQSILSDTFPPEKRGMAFAAFAIVVVVRQIGRAHV